MPTLLFVYGTLKRGMRNHALLADQEYLGPARTARRYRLYDCGPYPGLVNGPDGGAAVEGELWRVDEPTLLRLDALEEVPTLFDRREIPLEGCDEPAFVYFYARDVSGFTECSAWPVD